MMNDTIIRPYLVIPKLIEQPTWGGTYIVETKHWQDKKELVGKKIGQSYELYDKSNLSLATDSRDQRFTGELENNKSVETQTVVDNSVSLARLIASSPEAVLGKKIVEKYGSSMHLLLKFTQALGNSFQLHVSDGVVHPRWKSKPESWYYFEKGLITCGVKSPSLWAEYQKAVTALDRDIQAVAAMLKHNTRSYEDAQTQIKDLVKQYDPWQYVNLVRVEKGTLLDLSPCGIHHSWEEDLKTIPLGNVLYEIQLNLMDDVSSIRSFDKGKMGKDGSLRPLQIDDYFALADRSVSANDPQTHMRKSIKIQKTDAYVHERLLESKYYSMDKVMMLNSGKEFISTIDTFRHVFVRSGAISLFAGGMNIEASAGHSVFVPAECHEYAIKSTEDNTEVLLSY